MSETISIKGDVITKTITTTETFSKKELDKRLIEIEVELKDVEEQPDEMMMPNEYKFQRKMSLEAEKENITRKLK